MRRVLGSSWYLPAALVVLTFAMYWPGLKGGWLFDDYPVVFKNVQVQLASVDWASLRNAWDGFKVGEIGRPLATLSFGVNFWLGGDSPWGYKFVNLVLHALNVVLVWRLVHTIALLPQAKLEVASARLIAGAVAILWAIHPLQVSSVLYIVQRMEVLATTFVFLSLLLYLAGRRRQIAGARGGWRLLFAAAIVAACGLLSKETAALAGLYALCIELALLKFSAWSANDAKRLKAAYTALGCIAVLAAVYICLKYASASAYQGRWFTADERVLTQFRALPLYLGQMFFPAPGRMHFYYDDVVASTSLWHPITTVIGALFLAALVVLAWLVRRRCPLVTLGIAWFFAAHALTSSPINLELVFEHRNYFALLGAVLAAVAGVRALWAGFNPNALRLITAIIVIALSGLTLLRAATWGDVFLLATELAQENPRSPRAATDLGEQYMLLSGMRASSPYYAKARDEYLRAAALPLASPLPEAALLMMTAVSGQSADPAWWRSLQDKVAGNPLGAQEKLAVQSLLLQYYDGVPIDVHHLDQAIAALFSRMHPESSAYAQYADFILRAGLGQERAVRLYVDAFLASGSDMDYLQRLTADLSAAGHADIATQLLEKARSGH